MFKYLKQTAFFVAAIASVGSFSQTAEAAYSCSNSSYGVGGVYSTGNQSGTFDGVTYGVGSTYTSSACFYTNTANQSSTVATAQAVLRTAAKQTSGLIANRVNAALSGQGPGFRTASNGFSASTGMAAGNHKNKVGLWVAGSFSDLEDENVSTLADGQVYTALVGVDYQITKRAILGISVGYEDIDIDTAYNGFGGNDGNIEGDGYTIAPYLGVQLAKNVRASLTGGYSDLEYDTLRYDPGSGAAITGSTDAERYFVSGSVQGSHVYKKKWHLTGTGTVFYASEEKDAFTETLDTTVDTVGTSSASIAVGEDDQELGQVLLDARLGYLFQYAEPYALAGAEFDFSKDGGTVGTGQTEALEEDFGAKFGAGVNLRLGPNVTGGVEAYTVEFRDDYEEYTVTGGLRVKF